MEVYDNLLKETQDLLAKEHFKELNLTKYDWPMLKTNEFLMGKEVSFELGDRFKDNVVFHVPSSNNSLINEDKIYLIGEDLQNIHKNTNFSRVVFFNIDDIENLNKAYIGIKKLNYERYKIIPEGYMILSSSFENKKNVRVSKKLLKMV